MIDTLISHWHLSLVNSCSCCQSCHYLHGCLVDMNEKFNVYIHFVIIVETLVRLLWLAHCRKIPVISNVTCMKVQSDKVGCQTRIVAGLLQLDWLGQEVAISVTCELQYHVWCCGVVGGINQVHTRRSPSYMSYLVTTTADLWSCQGLL